MKKGIIRLWLLLIPIVSTLAQAPPAGPLETVRTSNEQIQAVLKSHDVLKGQARDDLFSLVEGVTDFPVISRRVVESFCKTMTAAECDEFDRTFQELLRVSSLRKLGRYRADRFEYLGEDVEGETALVRTLAYYDDEKVRLDYRMERRNGRWIIVNYIVDDVDTIRNYKKQFLRLFARGDVRSVIDRLKKKIAEYEQES